MKKIISLFKRDYERTHLIYDEVVEGAEWVVAGEGVATIKIDGSCCLVRGGILYKRYDAKQGKTPPPGFEPAQEPDPITGHWPGWLPVGEGPEDRWHREAFGAAPEVPNWTYELIGPKVQGNPYRLASHRLQPHGLDVLHDAPRTFDALRIYLEAYPEFEGIVWWRDINDVDCDKVKVKRRDFGLPWPPKN